MIEFLAICTQLRANIVIAGGTGTGKTTLLNALLGCISANERVVLIEDSAEIRTSHARIARLETRLGNIEGRGEITIRDLVRNALRMRPDRIIVGECRGGEALDMLQAMNTGHNGSLTTLHANTPHDAISRLETMCLMAGLDLPSFAIREQIRSAVNLLVQLSRLSDGSRRITSISEVIGAENHEIAIQTIFMLQEVARGSDGAFDVRFVATGYIPQIILAAQKQSGPAIDPSMFLEGKFE